VPDQAGTVSFTGHYDLTLAEVAGGTLLILGLRLSGTTAAAVPFIAGIETGWGQVLGNLADALAEPAPTHAHLPIETDGSS
jgi:hypothetical protein